MRQRGFRVQYRKGAIKQSRIFVGLDNETIDAAMRFSKDMAREGFLVSDPLPMYRSALLPSLSARIPLMKKESK